MRLIILGFFLLCFLNACIPSNTYEQTYFLPKKGWTYDNAKSFEFNIKDTSARYFFNFIIQHGETYPNSNIWFKMITQFPSGKKDTSKVEAMLALPDGQWLGRSVNGKINHTVNIAPEGATFNFNEAGSYKVTLIQDMRLNPLPAVDYIGLKLKRITK